MKENFSEMTKRPKPTIGGQRKWGIVGIFFILIMLICFVFGISFAPKQVEPKPFTAFGQNASASKKIVTEAQTIPKETKIETPTNDFIIPMSISQFQLYYNDGRYLRALDINMPNTPVVKTSSLTSNPSSTKIECSGLTQGDKYHFVFKDKDIYRVVIFTYTNSK